MLPWISLKLFRDSSFYILNWKRAGTASFTSAISPQNIQHRAGVQLLRILQVLLGNMNNSVTLLLEWAFHSFNNTCCLSFYLKKEMLQIFKLVEPRGHFMSASFLCWIGTSHCPYHFHLSSLPTGYTILSIPSTKYQPSSLLSLYFSPTAQMQTLTSFTWIVSRVSKLI